MASFKADCNLCDKSFSSNSNLRKHLKNIHFQSSTSIREQVPRKKEGNFKYVCSECPKSFNSLKNFKYHNQVHNQDSSLRVKVVQCPLCVFKGNSTEISKHFSDEHQILYEVENLEFDTWNTFMSWKKLKEKKTHCKFILKRRQEKSTAHFICHRSGTFKSKGKNLRLLKIQGSKKINAFCPAAIDVVIGKNVCRANFISTHVGHCNDLKHLNVSPTKREEIARQLQLKIPAPVILSNIRDSLEGDIEREHLLTNKDLHNIRAAFDISNEEVRDSSDARSVDILIKELRLQESHPVIFYKPQDVEDPNSILKPSDFVAIFMNDGQKEMLKEYGKNTICVDGTHGMGYDFILYTILVLDSVNQGFPCAFLLTNRSDQAIYEFFFSKIRDSVGLIDTNLFMSDMEVGFGNAWTRIMGPPKKQLYCTWHVVRAWQQNLNRIGGEREADKKNETYKQLRVLLEELDENKFELLLPDTIARWKEDKDTKNYAEYFESTYVSNRKQWAYCYRKQSGLNSNTHLESLHRTLKYVYLEGKKVKRLDWTISILMKFIRDRLFDQIILHHKGKLTKKIQDLRRRHRTAVANRNDSLITYDSTDERWIVSSKQIYYVEKNDANCTCSLICTLCNACLHRYSCTCLDYSIKWNMCKHVHEVCMIENEKNNVSVDINNANAHAHCATLESFESINNNNSAVISTKIKDILLVDAEKDVSEEDLKMKFNSVLNLAKNKDDRKLVMKYLNKVQLCIESDVLKSAPVCKKDNKSKSRDYVRNIQPQPRIYSTKKKTR
ncbi:uncharacterized protein LOC135832998 [Planococcus citri]|uniref:uncharacterized protein LOC135832998 n=1 Tax=Planococcus citri TaxID=170843 RepID=UPI0031F895C6